jgi:hypothetical protein
MANGIDRQEDVRDGRLADPKRKNQRQRDSSRGRDTSRPGRFPFQEAQIMLIDSHPNPKQVLVSTEESTYHPVQSTCVHHRDLPEIRAEGETPGDAAALLAKRLTWALENAGGDWRRTQLEVAIEDVKAFLDQER